MKVVKGRHIDPDHHKELNSYLALQDIRPAQNRYRSYLIRIRTIVVKNDRHYLVDLAWGRIGGNKRILSYVCNDIKKVDLLLKPVLRTRLRHGYRIIDQGRRFPEYKVLNEFQKGGALKSAQLSLFG